MGHCPACLCLAQAGNVFNQKCFDVPSVTLCQFSQWEKKKLAIAHSKIRIYSGFLYKFFKAIFSGRMGLNKEQKESF